MHVDFKMEVNGRIIIFNYYFYFRYAIMSQVKTEDIGKVITENLTFTMDDETSSERYLLNRII